MPTSDPLPVHFFTIVLNGQPFIQYHLERFKKLPFAWHWHIIEGLAALKHDTAWSLEYGATLPTQAAKDGRSIDGTAEYLDQIAADHPHNVTVYRAPERPGGRLWEGKLEMIAAPVPRLPDDCLLWEIDSDELWTVDQFVRLRELFLAQPERTAAVFYCWYFVGPGLAINRRRRYDEIEWTRAWRYKKGMRWTSHEPPSLGVPSPSDPKQMLDIVRIRPFSPVEMEREQLVFQHYAYVTEEQLRFKEQYYGYKDITAQWKALQANREFPAPLKKFLNWPWVNDKAMVEPVEACGIEPLATGERGTWTFHEGAAETAAGRGTLVRGILFLIRHGGGGAVQLLQRAINSARAIHPDIPVHVHYLPRGVQVIDKLELFRASPFQETLFLDADTVVLDRLDFGFEMAARHGVACCISECPWARRFARILPTGNASQPASPVPLTPDMVEYNPGVLFFSNKSASFFERWAALDKVAKPQITPDPRKPYRLMLPADYLTFSLAMEQSAKPPFVLPANWNFHPESQKTWWGPIKIWHDASEPPQGVVNFVRDQARPEALIQYVAIP